MSVYSRTLKHVNHKDFRRTHQRHLGEQEVLRKIERQKNLKEKKEIKEIKKLSSPFKSNWREELKIAQNQREEVVEDSINKEYDWRKQVTSDKKKYFEEGMVTSNFYNTGQQSEIDLSTAVDVPSEFTGNLISGHNFTQIRTAIISVDYSKHNTVDINLSGGGGASSWSDNTAGTFTPGVYAVFYALDNLGNLIALNGDLQGGSPRKVPPFGTLSTIDTLLNFGNNTLTIPSNLKQGNLKLLVYQNANIEPNIVGGVTPSTTFNSITLRGKTPVNVFVSLDNPEATSFVRTGSGDLSPKEKQKRLRDMLKASDEYVRQMYGNDFPGMGAAPPGESKFTSQELSDIDKQIQDLQAQSEKNKQDAQIKQWKAAGKLALDVAVSVGGIGALAKIPAAIRTAQTVSQVRQATKAYNTYKALEKIKDAAATQRMTSPGKYTAKPNPSHTPVKGGMMYKNSYEPHGEVITEKRKLKSPEEVLNKIPGYYDGKPAPLGFPETPPPEMVNGMHPDLVDGKKIANRFNRLDPESAKATPLTGNPHIDKKIKAARKKPK